MRATKIESNKVKSIELNQAEAIIVSYALEELLHSDDNLPFDEIGDLLDRFEDLSDTIHSTYYEKTTKLNKNIIIQRK